MRFRPPLAVSLAWRDLLGEGKLSLCTVLAVAAVVAPLLVLEGLRAGAVESLRANVLRDPNARAVLSVGNAAYDAPFLDSLRARPDVAHVSPRTRQLAASVLLEVAAGRNLRATVIPSGPGDPLLAGAVVADRQVIVSAGIAARLDLAPGGAVRARLTRTGAAGPESLGITLRVAAVAPASASDRDAVFVGVALAEAMEDWQEDRIASPRDGAVPQPAPRATHAGFRAYARGIEDVPELVAHLRRTGIETASRVEEIAPMLAVDRTLGRLLAAVAAVSGIGFILSLGAGLWAGVERKRRLLAGLRLMGMGTGGVIAVPVLQAVLLALAGAGAGAALALGAERVINAGVPGVVASGRLSAVSGTAVLLGLVATALGALVAAFLAAWRASRIEPYDAVRGP